MFCKHCGGAIEDDQQFCSHCGQAVEAQSEKSIDSADASQDVTDALKQPQESGVNTAGGQTIEEASCEARNGTPLINQSAADSVAVPFSVTSGKSNKVRKALLITVPVIVLALVIGLNVSALSNLALKLFSSPADYFRFVEEKAAGTTIEIVTQKYDNILEQNSGTIQNTAQLTVTLEESAQSMLSAAAGTDLSWLDEVTLQMDTTVKEGKESGIIALLLGNTEILTFHEIMDWNANQFLLGIPILNDQWLGGSLDSYMGGNDKQMLSVLSKAQLDSYLPSGKTMSEVLNRYWKAALEPITEVTREKGTFSAGGIEQSGTVLTASIDEYTGLQMGLAVLQKAEADKTLEKILYDIHPLLEDTGILSGTTREEMYKEFLESLHECKESLQEQLTDADRNETLLQITRYVNSNGDILATRISAEGGSVFWGAVRKGSEFGFEFMGDFYENTVKLSGSGTLKGSALTGTYTLSSNGSALIEGTIEALDLKVLQSGAGSGSITVRPTMNALQAMDLDEIQQMNPGLSIQFDQQSKQSNVCIGILQGENTLATIGITNQPGVGSGTKEPASDKITTITDSRQLETWLQSADFNEMIKRLQAAGVPSSLTDSLRQLAGMMKQVYNTPDTGYSTYDSDGWY